MAKTLRVEVVSVEANVWEGDALMVVARTVEGEIGILPDHEPLLAILAPGDVRIELPDGQRQLAHAEIGFLSVEHNTVRVVAQIAELVA